MSIANWLKNSRYNGYDLQVVKDRDLLFFLLVVVFFRKIEDKTALCSSV